MFRNGVVNTEKKWGEGKAGVGMASCVPIWFSFFSYFRFHRRRRNEEQTEVASFLEGTADTE